ncbi:hypothetical protein [Dyadobacter sp. CY343]|nr:hypothetical protein [Dyadobacter sp. CY343]MCE7059373.1 hypothetical protein [Dyadobacter sp. CY343]
MNVIESNVNWQVGHLIDWNIKHTVYHCGQIGILSRIVEKRFDFGLRLAR